jgi:DNA-binding transcriptional LysR family regulator
MELYQLKAFVAVAEHGNVTRAAEHLFASQPAVSAQIKTLEQSLGVALFHRASSGMTLTPQGHKLLEQARTTLAHAQGVEDLARHLRDGSLGRLRIGLNNGGPHLRIDALTRNILSQSPKIQLDFTNGTSGDVLDGICRYEIDAGFYEGVIQDNSISAIHLTDVELCIVTPNGWVADNWSELTRYPWVFTGPRCSYHRQLMQVCERHGVQTQKQFRVDHDSTTLTMVREGLAVSMVDRSYAQPYADAGELTIWNSYEASIPLNAITLKKRSNEPAIASFMTAVASAFDRPAPLT